MKIHKILVFFITLFAITTSGFSEEIVLDNRSSHPNKDLNSKIAIQWVSTAKEVDEGNKALIFGIKLNPNTIQFLEQSGKITLTIPKNAEYFRVLVWSKNEENPDLLTNWVDVIPKKTYTLDANHLVPAVLMSGTGC